MSLSYPKGINDSKTPFLNHGELLVLIVVFCQAVGAVRVKQEAGFSEMAGNETGPSNKRAASGNVGGKVSAVSLFAPMDNNRCCGSQQKGMAGYEYGSHTRLWVLHFGYSLM